MSAIRKLNSRMLDGARRYAAHDRSDPFSAARMVAHMKCGIASVSNAEHGKHAYYDAEPVLETRSYVQDGREVKFTVTRYQNVVRP